GIAVEGAYRLSQEADEPGRHAAELGFLASQREGKLRDLPLAKDPRPTDAQLATRGGGQQGIRRQFRKISSRYRVNVSFPLANKPGAPRVDHPQVVAHVVEEARGAKNDRLHTGALQVLHDLLARLHQRRDAPSAL